MKSAPARETALVACARHCCLPRHGSLRILLASYVRPLASARRFLSFTSHHDEDYEVNCPFQFAYCGARRPPRRPSRCVRLARVAGAAGRWRGCWPPWEACFSSVLRFCAMCAYFIFACRATRGTPSGYTPGWLATRWCLPLFCHVRPTT